LAQIYVPKLLAKECVAHGSHCFFQNYCLVLAIQPRGHAFSELLNAHWIAMTFGAYELLIQRRKDARVFRRGETVVHVA
jgi:hypothetical protein